MTKEYRDVEINRETVSLLLDAMRDRNVLPDDFDNEVKERLMWSSFCDLLDIAESTLGIDCIKQIAADALEIPRFRNRTKAATLFLALDDAYRFMLQSRRKTEFPHISAIVRTTDDYIDVHAYFAEDVQPNMIFFKMMEGAFDQIRILFGVQGVLTSEIVPQHATYRLRFGPDYKAPSRFFRRYSGFCLNLLSLPNLTRIREVLDLRTLRLEEELEARRATEIRLHQSESELVRRLENIHDVVLEFDDSGRLTYVSPNVQNRLGYEPSELMREPTVIFPPEHKLKFSELLHRAPGASDIYQLSLIKKDGTLSWHEMSSTSFLGGEHKHLILVARDINERRQMDTDNLNAQKLESLGQLSGAIAHDFNNLLVPILGNIELLIEDLDPASPMAEIADQIKLTATRASGLTKQLLIYSGDSYEQRIFDLSSELRSLLNLIQVTVPKHIRFHHVIEAKKFVYGDAIQLRQAVMNLVSNAAEAIGAGDGDLTLTLGSEGEKIRICVQDTGPGLSDQELSQAFEPLFSTKLVGRGLGLSAVQAIVKAHKGEILADSQPGVGTSFEIWLPIASEEAHGEKLQVQKGTEGRRILIVDDEDAVRKVAELYMKRLGYEVFSESDPEQAVAFFLEKPGAIDLVMLDLMMPKMNGFQVLEAMRQVKPDLPAMVVTGFGAGVELDPQHGTETTTTLRKPYMREDLERALEQLMGV